MCYFFKVKVTTSAKGTTSLRCLSTQFKCHDGSKCITSTWKCDSFADCADSSDEEGCGKFITANQTVQIPSIKHNILIHFTGINNNLYTELARDQTHSDGLRRSVVRALI